MTKLNEVYRCNVCGNIVEVVGTGVGTLVCCGQNMENLKANTVDAAKEKHVPVISKEGSKVKVIIGEIEHPMEKGHYIEWIEVIADGEVMRKFLEPGDKPTAEFEINAKELIAREYCSLHGLWSK